MKNSDVIVIGAGIGGLAAALGLLLATPALSHPHIFAEARLEIVGADDGTVKELRNVWRFDEVFSSSVLLDFDQNTNLKLDEAELAELEERVKFLGERGSGRKILTDKHKRELRRYKTDELRSGLRMLTLVYSEALKKSTEETAHYQTDSYVRAVKKIRDASVALSRNVNEKLLFENLDRLAEAHPAARDIRLERATSGLPIPLHPGAERFYREVGVLK